MSLVPHKLDLMGNIRLSLETLIKISFLRTTDALTFVKGIFIVIIVFLTSWFTVRVRAVHTLIHIKLVSCLAQISIFFLRFTTWFVLIGFLIFAYLSLIFPNIWNKVGDFYIFPNFFYLTFSFFFVKWNTFLSMITLQRLSTENVGFRSDPVF